VKTEYLKILITLAVCLWVLAIGIGIGLAIGNFDDDACKDSTQVFAQAVFELGPLDPRSDQAVEDMIEACEIQIPEGFR